MNMYPCNIKELCELVIELKEELDADFVTNDEQQADMDATTRAMKSHMHLTFGVQFDK